MNSSTCLPFRSFANGGAKEGQVFSYKKTLKREFLLMSTKPGTDLLSPRQTPQYHRRWLVSLLSSGWDQVGPSRNWHQDL